MDVGNSDFRFTKLNSDGKEEREGKTIRDPATAELHIDSLDRHLNNGPGMQSSTPGGVNQPQIWSKLASPLFANPTSTSSNMVINASRGRNLIYGYFERIALTQMQLFYRCPMFVSNQAGDIDNGCDRFGVGYYTPLGVQASTTVIFPQGNLDPTSIADWITTRVRVGIPAATAFTCNWNVGDPLTGRGYGQFVMDAGIVGAKIYIVPQFDPAFTRCIRMLGFGNSGYGGLDYANGVTSINPATLTRTIYSGPPTFLYTQYIDVCSAALNKFKRVKDTNSTQDGLQDVICRIYLTGANTSTSNITNSVIYANEPLTGTGANLMNYWPIINTVWSNPNWSKWSPEDNLTQIDFQLYDMFGLPLFWSPEFNTEFQATLTVSET
jgi:hypothetical protein